MHTVVITVATNAQSFPAGTVTGGIKVTLGSLPPVVVPAAPFVATFTSVPAGDYPITAQAVDAAGADLGAAVTGTVTVAPDVVNVDVPASISVAVS